MKSWILVLSLPFFLGACAHSVHSYQVQNSKNFNGQLIESNSEQMVILGFTRDTTYVNQAYNNLAKQCVGGNVEGIQTRYSTALGFFSWKNRIRMRGYCSNKPARQTNSTDDETYL